MNRRHGVSLNAWGLLDLNWRLAPGTGRGAGLRIMPVFGATPAMPLISSPGFVDPVWFFGGPPEGRSLLLVPAVAAAAHLSLQSEKI